MVMTLRTASRRISPRTRKRYRAIREFFRRALGSPSEREIKINSSIAVNVTNLKRKVVGIENQLDGKFNRNCHDLEYVNNLKRNIINPLLRGNNDNIVYKDDPGRIDYLPDTEPKSTDTKILYVKSEEPVKKSDESEYVYSFDSNSEDINRINMATERMPTKHKKNKVLAEHDYGVCHANLRRHRAQSNFENLFAEEYSTTSFHSISAVPLSNREHYKFSRHSQHEKKFSRRADFETKEYLKCNEPKKQKHEHQVKQEGSKKRKVKPKNSLVDQDFIADIIKRQYKQVKLFGGRPSNMSQISAPVCRDQEFSLKENLMEGDLCSCCYGHNCSFYERNHGIRDMRSLCDTRVYTTKRYKRQKHHRKQYVDTFNDSALYDLVPVKEKSSPKSRRKFVEENLPPYGYYREVPPSPKTQRPRLNLRAQDYSDIDAYDSRRAMDKMQQARSRRKQKRFEYSESDVSGVIAITNPTEFISKQQKSFQVQNLQTSPETITSTPHTDSPCNNNSNDSSLNKTQDTDHSVDKTDKALCEIKDILQSFLQEIKKESSQSQCERIPSKVVPVTEEKLIEETPKESKLLTDAKPNSLNNFSNPPPFISPFANSCCYPLMPVYHMNCLKGGYVMPSTSYTYGTCENQQSKGIMCEECSNCKQGRPNETGDDIKDVKNTEDLIKQIYKFVAEGPQNKDSDRRDKRSKNVQDSGKKIFTTRSVGSSTTRATRNDAKVGTVILKCQSKSCEAIGSKLTTESYYTSTTQSDTVLDKMSLEVSQSNSQLSLSSIFVKKKKKGFARILQSFFKKKKKQEAQELSETESSLQVDIKPKSRPHALERIPHRMERAYHQHERGPYNRDVINYMMHGEEYSHQPPVPPHHSHHGGNFYSPRGYGSATHCPCIMSRQPHHSEFYTPHRVYQDTIHEHTTTRYPSESSDFTPVSNYPSPYNQHWHHAPAHPPLCLKEVEVRSTGTQSEKKMSFFSRIARPSPPRLRNATKMKSTTDMQTSSQNSSSDKRQQKYQKQKKSIAYGKDEPRKEKKTEPKKGFFSGFREAIEEKAKEMENDPMRFSFGSRKKLNGTVKKNKNATLNNLFKNPLSPKTFLMNSLLKSDFKPRFDGPVMPRRPGFFM